MVEILATQETILMAGIFMIGVPLLALMLTKLVERIASKYNQRQKVLLNSNKNSVKVNE